MRQLFFTAASRMMPLGRQGAPLVIGAACLWLLFDRLGSDTLHNISTHVHALPIQSWLAAAAATGLSFWALGRYDVILHRHLDTGCAPRQASLAGAAAIALSQTLGMGIVTASLVRWRLLPGLGAAAATRITVLVAVSFLFGLALILCASELVLPGTTLPPWLATVGIAVLLAAAFLSAAYPTLSLGRVKLPMLPLPGLVRIAGLTLLDTGAAALALYILMPQGLDLTFTVLFPVYLLALGAALVSGTPGGVGPFELTLLAFLPFLPEGDVMSGIVAFRIVYYAIPAALAAAALLRPFSTGQPASPSPALRPLNTALDARQTRAELGVCRQNGAAVLGAGCSDWAVVQTGQTMTALFAPLQGTPGPTLRAAHHYARLRNKVFCLYKLTDRAAARIRRHGFKAMHIADEAVLCPAAMHALAGPAYRQLRRKLRQADTAGVVVERAHSLPIETLRRIDADWQARNGRARGLSMGQFCPDYLSTQKVYVAGVQGHVVGFISLHDGPSERCLDLMRANADAPDGTMHALVTEAIRDAHRDGIGRLSLAGLPADPHHAGPLERRLRSWIARRSGARGLVQFKASFAPRREPLYALAASWPALALALADIAWSIRRPESNLIHHEVEEYGVAPAAQT